MSRADRRKLSHAKRKAKALHEALQDAQAGGKTSVFARVLQQWQGPLPPPEWLKGYDETVPGLANRLFACFERQVDHRIAIERLVVAGNTRAQSNGQWFAFIIALSVMAFAFFLVILGHVGWGIGVVLVDVLALAGIFVYGRESQKSERKDKTTQLLSPPKARPR